MCCRIDEAISKNAKISKEQRRKMDAHKALITNIFNNSTLVEVPFFRDHMCGKKTFGDDFLKIWSL